MFQDHENKADPLKGTVAEEGELLFKQIARLASGHSHEVLLNVASNLIVNSLRQQHARAYQAEEALDELHARNKRVLLDLHYCPGRHGTRVSGTFPFAQILLIPKVM